MLKMTQLIFLLAQLVQIPKSVNKMSVLFQRHRTTLIQQTGELHWKKLVYLNSGLQLQQIGEELFTLFQTKVVNDTIRIVKGITLKQISFTFCVNGESCTPKDFPNLVSTVLELEDCIKKFDEAQICTGIFIKDNFKLNCKLLASDTCYKEDKRSNIWKSYECDSLIFNSTVQDDPCKSTVYSCFFWRKLKGCVTKLLWKEKNQDCGVIAKYRKVIRNSKRILSRKVTKLQVSLSLK